MDKVRNFFNNRIVKTTTKVISWIVLIFLVLLASILVYYVVSSKLYEIKGKKYEPLVSLYTIISPSMEPNINVYDVVITKRVNPNDIKEGDVITFISSSTLGEGLTITHRVKSVIKTEGDIKFRTQGDNNPIPDSALVTSNNLLGKVIFTIPFLGHIQFMLQSKSGWLFCLLIPAIIVVIYDVVKVLKLSNVKQRLNENLKEENKDEKLVEKQENLKQKLQNKYIHIEKTNKNDSNSQEENKDEIGGVDIFNVKTPEEIEDTINRRQIIKVENQEEVEDNEKYEIEKPKEKTPEINSKFNNFNFEEDDEIILPKKKDE